jgi:hypothetical protein
MWQHQWKEMSYTSRKETKIQKFMNRATANVENEMYNHTSSKWSHQNSNKRFQKNLEAIPGKHSIDLLQRTEYLEHHT